ISLFDSNALVSPPPTTVVCALSLHDALPISAHAEADVQIGGGEVAQSLPGGGAALAFLGRPLLEAAGLELLGQDLVQVEGREVRSEEHTSELQSRENLVCRLLLEKKKRTEKH